MHLPVARVAGIAVSLSFLAAPARAAAAFGERSTSLPPGVRVDSAGTPL